jgi:hypothetical protein
MPGKLTQDMKILLKDKISSFKQILNQEIKKVDDNIIIRNRNNNSFRHILYSLILKNSICSSYETANSRLKYKNILNISTQALHKFILNMDNTHFLKFNNRIIDYYYSEHTEIRYIAVDGSQINLDQNLVYDKFQLSNNQGYCSALVSSLYDVSNNIPINLHMSKNFDERNALVNQLNFLHKNDVLIMDRGYFSFDLLETLSDKGIDVIFRLKENLTLVKELKDNNDVLLDVPLKNKIIKLRLVKYIIDDKEFYLATTLFYATLLFLQNMYWKRWDVETSFRTEKYTLSLGNIKSQCENTVKHDLFCHQFILLINAIINKIIIDVVNIDTTKFKINQTFSIHWITTKIIYLLFYRNMNKKTTVKIITILTLISMTLVKIIANRHYDRIRKKPSTKWNVHGNRYGNGKKKEPTETKTNIIKPENEVKVTD